MITMDQALDRLVHDRSYRRAFLERRVETLELDPEDVTTLASLDGAALAAFADRIADELFSRKHAGSGGLLELYPRTIDAWRSAHPGDTQNRELAFRFMESAAFREYRELPFCGLGISMEEAFFRFCEVARIGDTAEREHEFLSAMIKLLAASPNAAIRIPECIRRTCQGFLAVSSRGAPTLYATAHGRVVTGALTPFLADLLEEPASAAASAARHGVSQSVVEQCVRRFSDLGIIG